MKSNRNKSCRISADGRKLSRCWRIEVHQTVLLAMLSAVIFIYVSGCTRPLALNSRWRDREIDVDSIDSDWGRATIYVPEATVSLTLLNDDDYLYIRLASRDRDIKNQVMGMGLTIWIDPKGGKNKTFGIHFPIGMHDKGMPLMTRGREDNPEEGINKMFEESMNELEIIGPGKGEVRRMLPGVAEAHGLNIKLGMSKGNLVYGLKIPLIKSPEDSFSIGIDTAEIDTNKAISIGFETPEINKEEMRKKMEGERPGGMPPGGGPGMPPGGSGGMPGGMPGGGPPGGGAMEMPEPLNLWKSVKLSAESSVQR